MATPTYLIADLNFADPPAVEAIEALTGAPERRAVGGEETHLLMPTYASDARPLERLVEAGIGSVIRSALAPDTLADWLAHVARVIEPRGGRLMALQLLVPAVLCFTLLHADKALAERLSQGLDQVTLRGTDAALYQARFERDALRVALLNDVAPSVMRRDAVVPAQMRNLPMPTGGTELTICGIEGAETTRELYGDFPELTTDFMDAFEVFQRRLCIRRMAAADADVLYQPLSLAVEEQILKLAQDCGYWHELAFDRMAFAALVLGVDRVGLPDRFGFECPADPNPVVARGQLGDPFRYAQLRMRGLRDFGYSPMDD